MIRCPRCATENFDLVLNLIDAYNSKEKRKGKCNQCDYQANYDYVEGYNKCFTDTLIAATELKKLYEFAVQALKDIIAPISMMERNLKDGEKLDGMMAVNLQNNAQYLREIATDALKELGEPNT